MGATVPAISSERSFGVDLDCFELSGSVKSGLVKSDLIILVWEKEEKNKLNNQTIEQTINKLKIVYLFLILFTFVKCAKPLHV